MRHLPLISICGYVGDLSVMRVRVGVATVLGLPTGIDEIFQLKFFSSMKIVGTTGLGGLWALEWVKLFFRSIDRY